MQRRGLLLTASLIFGLVFLYTPMLVLIIYSFNESKLVTVWGGWSARWYVELFSNDQLLTAAFLSLKLAAISGFMAAILGTLAAYALDRFGRFAGRRLLGGLISGPLARCIVRAGSIDAKTNVSARHASDPSHAQARQRGAARAARTLAIPGWAF